MGQSQPPNRDAPVDPGLTVSAPGRVIDPAETQAHEGGRPSPEATGLPQIPGYEMLGELGRGGMGVVYKARQMALNRLVAIKMIGGSASSDQLVRFQKEAEAVARVQHPNIIQIFEVGTSLLGSFLAIEYVDGGTLKDKVAGVPQPPRDAARMVETLARAIHHAHERRLIHRDLKPHNVLLTATGVPKVTDFGLARSLDAAGGVTMTSEFVGTPAYAAPEQVAGRASEVGPATDVYALGVILYELLAGRVPFEADSIPRMLRMVTDDEPVPPRRLRPDLPYDLQTICLKCLQKEPSKRYVSAEALADDLHRFQAGEPITARPVGVFERVGRWARRNPAVAALLGTVFALLTAVAGVATASAVLIDQSRREADVNAEAARRATQAESAARKQAQDAAAQASYRLTRLHVATGTQHQERNEPFTALLWYARAWEADRDRANESGHRARLGAVLAGQPRLVGVCFHPSGVDDVDIDRAGTRLVTRTTDRFGKRGHAAYLWDFAAGKLSAPPLDHDGPVRHAGFSPDGSQVLTTSEDRTAVLWDAATGKRLRTLMHDAPVLAGAFASDGKTAATAAGKDVRLWDPATGEPTGVKIALPAEVYAVEFSRSGNRLLTADRKGTARVWDAHTGQPAGPAISHSAPERDETWFYKMGPAISPDGRLVLTAAPVAKADAKSKSSPVGGEIPWQELASRAVEVETGKVLWEAATSGRHLSWSVDGRRAVVSFRNVQRLIDPATGKVHLEAGNPRESAYAALTPDGRVLATGFSGGGILLFDTATGQPHGQPIQCADFLRRLRISADGKWLVAASLDGTARVWDLASRAGPAVLPYADDCGRADVPVYPDGSSASPDGRTRFRSGADGEILERPAPAGPKRLPHSVPVTVSRFNPQGTRLATFAGNTLRVWDAATGEPVGPALPLGDGPVPLPRLEFGGERVAAVFPYNPRRPGEAVVRRWADRPGAVLVWEADTGRRLFTVPTRIDSSPRVFGLAEDHGEVRQAAISPDGRFVAVGVESSGELSVFAVDTGATLHRTKAFRGYLNWLVFAPSGRTVLLASTDRLVREMDATTGRLASPALRTPGAPWRFAVSPDGGRVATAHPGRLLVWDSRTGDLLANFSIKLEDHDGCWFSKDGATVGYRFGGKYWRLRLPNYDGPADAVPRAVRLIAGRYLDETNALADLGPDEFIDNRHAYLEAWLAWQGLNREITAQR